MNKSYDFLGLQSTGNRVTVLRKRTDTLPLVSVKGATG